METLSKNKIKWIKSLRLKKNRESESLFIVEGEKMVNELLQHWSESIEFICASTTSVLYDGVLYQVEEKTMKEISSLSTPNTALAVVRKPELKAKNPRLVLALDGIQDPGNLGTIIRTADWFGVDQIVCSIGTVDAFNSKVVQSSMGSLFRVSIIYVDLRDYLKQTNLPIYGALLEGASIYATSLEKAGVIIMGNEGNGISAEIKAFVQHPIHIPKYGGAESLNVSIATGIVLSEFRRQ